jgi:hypothetical protein
MIVKNKYQVCPWQTVEAPSRVSEAKENAEADETTA